MHVRFKNMLAANSFLLVVLAALSSLVGSQIVRFEQCLPCHCHHGPYPGLNTTANIADCTKRKLREIPTHLPTDIDVLILNHNPISTIAEGALSVYSNLQAFVMHECNIISIPARAFDGLLNLKILDLHSQWVGIQTWAKKALVGLPKLEVLNISVEPSYPSSGTFAEAAQILPNLQELNVHFISNITENFFAGLKLERLYITVDKTMYLPATLLVDLSPESKLKRLHICSRSLRAIPEQLLNSVIGSLEVFHLVVKYIPRLPGNLFHFDTDVPYDIEEPKVQSNLTEIWLVGVSSIPPHLFKELGLLRRLVIRQFNDLSDDAFSGLTMLQELTITDSVSFTNVSKYLLRNLYELTDLKISNTQIAELKEEHMESNSELIYLDLSDNKLTSVEGYTFWFMTNMQLLDLSRNRFKTFEQQVFEVSKLLTLDLSYNNIEELQEEMFGDLYYLAELKLRGNQLSSLPPGIFEQLSSVRWIDLSLNSFINFSGSYIEECDELTLLDLSDNCLQTFNMTTFKEDYPNVNVNLDRNPLAGKETCREEIKESPHDNSKYALPPADNKSKIISFLDAHNTKRPKVDVASQTDSKESEITQEDRDQEPDISDQTSGDSKPNNDEILDTEPIVKDSANSLNKNCTLINSTGDRKNISTLNCPPSKNEPDSGNNGARLWVTVLVSSTVVFIGVIVCAVVAVVVMRRRSTYYRVQAEQEASVQECAHCVGAGGEGLGRPRPLGPFDDDFHMEHTRFV